MIYSFLSYMHKIRSPVIMYRVKIRIANRRQTGSRAQVFVVCHTNCLCTVSLTRIVPKLYPIVVSRRFLKLVSLIQLGAVEDCSVHLTLKRHDSDSASFPSNTKPINFYSFNRYLPVVDASTVENTFYNILSRCPIMDCMRGIVFWLYVSNLLCIRVFVRRAECYPFDYGSLCETTTPARGKTIDIHSFPDYRSEAQDFHVAQRFVGERTR